MEGLRNAMSNFAWLGLLAVCAGYLGKLHPVFDSIAVFRLHMMIGLLVLLIVTIVFRAVVAFRTSVLALSICAVGLAPTVLPAHTIENPSLRGYSHNLRFNNSQLKQVEASIRESNADFVMLQEVSRTTIAVVDALADMYSTRVVCEFRGDDGVIGGVAILTRLPVIGTPKCSDPFGLGAITVKTDAGPVALASIHLAWPWPYEQAEHMKYMLRRLGQLEGPVILAGDFNMVPWSTIVAQIAETTDTHPVSGLRLSFHRYSLWPGLPIDHVLIDKNMEAQVELLDKFGSDHTALRFDVKL